VGLGAWVRAPTPNPPIPNPQSPIPKCFKSIKKYFYNIELNETFKEIKSFIKNKKFYEEC